MQLAHHIEALQRDLSQFAELGDEATANAARSLSVALRAAFGLRVLDVLTEATLELSAQIPNGHVEVRLAGQDPELVYVEEEAAPAATADDAALTARITLRLPDNLKSAIDAVAAAEGVSVNTWIVRVLARVAGTGSTTPRRGPGKRLTGYARS